MKKACLVCLILFLIFSGCSSKQETNVAPNESLAQVKKIDKPTLQKTKQVNAISNESVVQIQTLDEADLQVEKCITVDEALKLCNDIIGSKDDENFMFLLAEEHTGRKVGYTCNGVITYNDKQYYIMRMGWTGEKESHWSTIGNIAVSVVGNEIHDVRAYEDEFYSLTELLWYKE